MLSSQKGGLTAISLQLFTFVLRGAWLKKHAKVNLVKSFGWF